MAMPVVEAVNLRRTYRTTTGTFRRRALDVEAVRGVSFEIGEGELFGLLGPNGAGKTTTIKMLITLVGLKGREKERAEGYSRGMRQRLHIARGLLHDPPVVFLDEPTLGVDPVGARELRATIASLTEGGKTVLLTTHYMFEADQLCDRIAVIAKGEIVGEGTPRELKERVSDGTVVEIEVYGVTGETVERMRRINGVRTVAVEDREQAQLLVVQTEPGTELTHSILAELDGASVGRVTAREPTLEDAYVALVSES